MLTEHEQGNFKELLCYLHAHPHASYVLKYPSEIIEAEYDTDFESDNGLEEDEPGYEEYHCIVFRRKDNGILFEVNFHDLPEQVCSEKTVII